jgi:penicillin amidase
MGRTDSLAFGFTYGFMDMVDFFVEEVADGRCRRGETSLELATHRETIERKSNPPIDLHVHENDLGVLETDGSAEVPDDGIYLTRAWSAHRAGAASSLRAIRALPSAHTVADAQKILRDVAISSNWVLADRQGSIGYQQSGLLPDRRHSGVHPVPAWDPSNHWRGTVPDDRLHSELDPDDGVVVSANNEVNPPDGPTAVNLSMGPYRHDRIRELLEIDEPLTPAWMKAVQLDLRSLQAERLMAIWRPFLPDSLAGRMLGRWDYRYDVASRGATLFESVYQDLLARVVGDRVFGREAWYTIVDETAIFADYYHFFDRVLLGEDPFWWGEEGREAVLTGVFTELLTHLEPYRVVPWGRRHRTTMANIFFRGKLPGFLGFDHGPIEMPGNRATVVQGGLFVAHGRDTTFAPSWRCITDLGDDEALTALAGGPSGSRFSRWYTTDIERWLKGEYKLVRLESRQSTVDS